jgi:hypothetical protein
MKFFDTLINVIQLNINEKETKVNMQLLTYKSQYKSNLLSLF